MSRKNAFLYDIDVPEIVQEKAEIAFSIIKAEGERTMKEDKTETTKKDRRGDGKAKRDCRRKIRSRSRKRNRMAGVMAGAAACAAIAALVVSMRGIGNAPAADYAGNGTKAEGIPVGEVKEDENFLSTIDRMFTLQVWAAELEEGQPVPLVENTQQSDNDSQIDGKQANSWVMGGLEGDVDYCINLPLSCTGSNIEKVTYSVNRGAFQVVQPEGESIIIDGEAYEGEINGGNVGMIGGGYEEETGQTSRPYEMVFYRSFTLDYRKQSDQDTWINLCNIIFGKPEIQELIWGEENSLEEKNRGMQSLFQDTIITCTVQYQDKTTQSVDILVNSRIMTCAEAGVEAKDDPNREEIFITFELQGEKEGRSPKYEE